MTRHGDKTLSSAGRTVVFTVMCFVAIGLMCVAFGLAMSLPEVQISAQTGRCVRVLDPFEGGESEVYSCAVLPKKYDVVYVAGQ
jgi:hypothetical protein